MGMNREESRMRMSGAALVLLVLLAWPVGVAQAQGRPGPADGLEQRVAALEREARDARQAADNAWVLGCSALVLLMTTPGLALFYGGLVRKRNVLGTMMPSLAIGAVVTVLWAAVGYSLCFHRGNALLGGLGHAFLRGVGTAPDPDYASNVPQQTFMIFQLMFAILSPAIVVGSIAERARFPSVLLFGGLWSLVVYAPLAHMVWGSGGLLSASHGGRFPALDFAGGTVVHVSSGVSALVAAVYVGRRHGYPRQPMPPHSVVLSFVGACLLWIGWFGFNAGSALGATGLASSAFVATQLAAAAGSLVWSATEWVRYRKPSALGAITGGVAGLVGITPASGFVGPMSALAIGAAAGLVCYAMVAYVKVRLGYDDSLDAFGIHGAGGTIGAILTGVFATRDVNPVFRDAAGAALPVGLVDGHLTQPLNQILAVTVASVLAGVGSFVLLKIVDVLLGFRITEEQEVVGLDLTQHGEDAYNLEG
jgi:Amt family ammonium transporter